MSTPSQPGKNERGYVDKNLPSVPARDIEILNVSVVGDTKEQVVKKVKNILTVEQMELTYDLSSVPSGG